MTDTKTHEPDSTNKPDIVVTEAMIEAGVSQTQDILGGSHERYIGDDRVLVLALFDIALKHFSAKGGNVSM